MREIFSSVLTSFLRGLSPDCLVPVIDPSEGLLEQRSRLSNLDQVMIEESDELRVMGESERHVGAEAVHHVLDHQGAGVAQEHDVAGKKDGLEKVRCCRLVTELEVKRDPPSLPIIVHITSVAYRH